MSNSDESIDDDVICLAKRGDRDAQRQIYEAVGPRVYRTAKRIVGENDAADVAQDVFILLFRKLPSFRHESAFATWLHRLVVNESLQYLRKRGRRVMRTQPLPVADLAPSDQTSEVGEGASAVGELAELVRKAMERVDPELKLIFELKEVDELSYAQIGEIVGISEGTVGSRLNRARRELRDQLLKLGWEP